MDKKKKVKYPIKYKFLFFIIILIGLSVFTLGYILINLQERNLTSEMIKRGEILVKGLSRITFENFTTDEIFPIILYCNNLVKEEGVEEAFFLTDDGYILAHNDAQKVTPREKARRLKGYRWKKKKKTVKSLMDFPPSAEYNKPFFQKARELEKDDFGYQLYKGEKYYDIYAPIKHREKYFGSVHVIFSREVLFRMVSEAKKRTLFVLIGVFVFGLTGALLLSSIVVKPVRVLAQGVSIIGTGNLEHKIKLKSHDELGYLAGEFNDMTGKLKQAQKVMIEKQKMENEMQIASSIQQMLLPKVYPKFSNLAYGSYYQATKEVGGDYYDFIRLSDSKLGIIVADVSGKGVPGSLIMSMFRSIIRSNVSPELDSYRTLCRTNSIIYPDIYEGMFVTVFYGIFDLLSSHLDFSIAGHEPLVIFNCRTKDFKLYNAEGIPVGIDNSDGFSKILKSSKIKLSKDDLIVQFTDGITEAMNPKREQFGEDRFYETIKSHGDLHPEKFIEAIKQNIVHFTEGASQSDDITIVAIKMLQEKLIQKEKEEIPVARKV
ncbi:MAG: SpoIIE family protein phosphatase [Spirochaetes bacterium]|nr:SpoIIE family protein phosphatase [Spirochaetota bacterium]